jgi:hypothetical protein
MENKKNLESLFFEPVVSSLRAISKDDNIITSNNHKLISYEKSFLGIKSTNYLESTEIFLLKHREAFELCQHLYEELTKYDGKVLNHFHSPNLSWIAILYSSQTFENNDIANDMIKNKLIIDSYSSLNTFDEVQKQVDSNDLKMPKNIDLVVGINSGYNEGDIPTFYLILRHKQDQYHSFLTIDNYKFSTEEIEAHLRENKSIDVLKKYLKENVSKHFEYQLKSFVMLYNQLSRISISKENFIPVCLDLYNLNRSLTSLKNDKNLQRRVKSLIKACEQFINTTSSNFNCSLFIDFIIRYNYINLESIEISRDKIENLFVQKRAYQKIESIFPSFSKSQTNFIDYLSEQGETWEKVVEII